MDRILLHGQQNSSLFHTSVLEAFATVQCEGSRRRLLPSESHAYSDPLPTCAASLLFSLHSRPWFLWRRSHDQTSALCTVILITRVTSNRGNIRSVAVDARADVDRRTLASSRSSFLFFCGHFGKLIR